MLSPHYDIPETPPEDWDDRTTETYSVTAFRTASPARSVKDPREKGDAV